MRVRLGLTFRARDSHLVDMDPLIQDIDLPKQPTMTYREMVKIMYGHPCHVHVEHGSEGHLTKLKYDSSGNDEELQRGLDRSGNKMMPFGPLGADRAEIA
jgi:hypothetical protein